MGSHTVSCININHMHKKRQASNELTYELFTYSLHTFHSIFSIHKLKPMLYFHSLIKGETFTIIFYRPNKCFAAWCMYVCGCCCSASCSLPRQRLSGRTISPGLQMFGQSISGSVDMDGNGYAGRGTENRLWGLGKEVGWGVKNRQPRL